MDLVSIITPVYKCEKYIERTINSVLAQTYPNWEMLLVDDCSPDKSAELICSFARLDSRFRYIKLENNSGAAIARNVGLENARGRFIAYLDADDIWKPDKLEKQISFMKSKPCGFSCTSYEVIDDAGKPLNKRIHMLPEADYAGFLTNNLLQTAGIMVDTEIVDKKYLEMPDIRRRQDAATWLQVLKAGYICYGLDEILAEYRRTECSLSSNKAKAAKGMWDLYRDIEHLSVPFSCYCFIRYALLAVWKRIYLKK